jgi:hypothetical protein
LSILVATVIAKAFAGVARSRRRSTIVIALARLGFVAFIFFIVVLGRALAASIVVTLVVAFIVLWLGALAVVAVQRSLAI